MNADNRPPGTGPAIRPRERGPSQAVSEAGVQPGARVRDDGAGLRQGQPVQRRVQGGQEEFVTEVAEALRASGVAGLRAIGGSMAPAIRSRDTLVIVGCGVGGVRPHDVVVFARDGRLFAHRLLEIVVRAGTPWLRTRGDALWRPDGLVAPPTCSAGSSRSGGTGTFSPPEPCRPLRRARALVASECIALRSLLARVAAAAHPLEGLPPISASGAVAPLRPSAIRSPPTRCVPAGSTRR